MNKEELIGMLETAIDDLKEAIDKVKSGRDSGRTLEFIGDIGHGLSSLESDHDDE